MKTSFPVFSVGSMLLGVVLGAEACLVTIVLPGQETLAPKGWVKFRDVDDRTEVFSLNIFPPKEIKANVPFT